MIVMGVRCHYCSKFRAPGEVRTLGDGSMRICLKCLDWHHRAIRMLAGEPPPGCQECGLRFEELKENPLTGDLRMYLVVKDGIYQILCQPCERRYSPKRADLLRETTHGRQRRI